MGSRTLILKIAVVASATAAMLGAGILSLGYRPTRAGLLGSIDSSRYHVHRPPVGVDDQAEPAARVVARHAGAVDLRRVRAACRPGRGPGAHSGACAVT